MARTIINDPTGELNNGMPTFAWGSAPRDVYATRRQLAQKGLRKGGQPVAAVMIRPRSGGKRGDLVAYLYLIELAKPQFTKSPAKLAAVHTAAKARCRCEGPCRRRWPELDYIPRFGICEACTAGEYGPLTNDAEFELEAVAA